MTTQGLVFSGQPNKKTEISMLTEQCSCFNHSLIDCADCGRRGTICIGLALQISSLACLKLAQTFAYQSAFYLKYTLCNKKLALNDV